MHRLLEWIGQPGAPMDRADWPAAAEAAAAQFDAGPQSSQVLALAREIVDSPECKRFFTGAALRWAANEVPLSHQGELLRLDRLVRLDEGAGPVWWVLDYKLGDTPEAVAGYRAQMARYVVAVQAAQPGEAVQGAFITGRGRVVGSG